VIARILTPDKRTTIEVEADTMKGLFEAVADVQGVFGNLTCAHCDSVNTQLVYRPGKTKDGKPFKNYECWCHDCRRILSFGQKDDGKGSMWAKNKDSDGGRRGWKTWEELTDRGGGGGDSQHTDDTDQRTATSEEAY